MENILYARRVFEVLQSYFHFVANFNIQNTYSMVCHAVGLHKDIFHCGAESLENKVLFVRSNLNGTNGRGGFLFGNNYCFALLNWGFSGRSHRSWVVANLAQFDIPDPSQRWHQPTMDELLPEHTHMELEEFQLEQEDFL